MNTHYVFMFYLYNLSRKSSVFCKKKLDNIKINVRWGMFWSVFVLLGVPPEVPVFLSVNADPPSWISRQNHQKLSKNEGRADPTATWVLPLGNARHSPWQHGCIWLLGLYPNKGWLSHQLVAALSFQSRQPVPLCCWCCPGKFPTIWRFLPLLKRIRPNCLLLGCKCISHQCEELFDFFAVIVI